MPDEFVEAKAHRDLKLDTVTWDIWGYIWVFPKTVVHQNGWLLLVCEGFKRPRISWCTFVFCFQASLP